MTMTGAQIPLDVANVNRCICPMCPVQVGSQCVRDKTKSLQAVLKSAPLDPTDIPAVYCGAGKAACPDLSFKQACICQSCPIYKEFGLRGKKPILYYCRDGAVV